MSFRSRRGSEERLSSLGVSMDGEKKEVINHAGEMEGESSAVNDDNNNNKVTENGHSGTEDGAPLVLRRTSTEGNMGDYLEDGEKRMLIIPQNRRAAKRRGADASSLESREANDVVIAKGGSGKAYQTVQDKGLSDFESNGVISMDLASPHIPSDVEDEAMKKDHLSAISRGRSKSVSLDGSASSLLGEL